MKRKYVTIGVLLACRSRIQVSRQDVRAILEKTIAERRALLLDWGKSFWGEKDIHAQLEETIAARIRLISEWEKLFLPVLHGEFKIQEIKAA